ncbi:hypothetical protein P7L87_24660, partial [Vibrio parahaemolyticus]|nr:hypothetical protein [Vibrio parahaemolyticus]
GPLMALDPDANETFTFSLTDNAGGRFTIGDNNKLVVAAGAKFDYETASSVQVKVKVTDSGGLSFEKTLSIGVTDVSEIGGSARNEKLRGTESAEIINGGAGNDWIWGNGGDDTINGGSGKDIFQFTSKLGTSKTDRKVNFDTIKDFSAKDDSFWLDNAIFKKAGSGSPTKPKQLSKSFFAIDKAKDKNDYLIYSKKTGVLSYDADGSGKGAAVEFAQLKKGLALTYKDFFII